MSEDKASGKVPYEPPRLIDLTGGVAHAQETAGLDCRSGSVAAGQCMNGQVANQNQCKSGSAAQKEQCQAGGSPGKHCMSGSTAYGGKCQAGSVATAKCWAGSAPGK